MSGPIVHVKAIPGFSTDQSGSNIFIVSLVDKVIQGHGSQARNPRILWGSVYFDHDLSQISTKSSNSSERAHFFCQIAAKETVNPVQMRPKPQLGHLCIALTAQRSGLGNLQGLQRMRNVDGLEVRVRPENSAATCSFSCSSRLQVAYTSRPPGLSKRDALWMMDTESPRAVQCHPDSGAISGLDCGAGCPVPNKAHRPERGQSCRQAA